MSDIAREVLYFPTIEFPDDGWLKGALCYWDKIYRIVPASYKPQDSNEVKIAQDAGLVESIFVTKADLIEAASRFENFWEEAPLIPWGIHGFDEEPIRLHPEKVDERIRPQLEALAQHIDPDGFLNLSKGETKGREYLFMVPWVSLALRPSPQTLPLPDFRTEMGCVRHSARLTINARQSGPETN